MSQPSHARNARFLWEPGGGWQCFLRLDGPWRHSEGQGTGGGERGWGNRNNRRCSTSRRISIRPIRDFTRNGLKEDYRLLFRALCLVRRSLGNRCTEKRTFFSKVSHLV